eukprot:m.113495 g.113495  ORF g.113495 m.113495 type:complete len:354 (-) comp14133_c0_seq5:705-1766(-)
MKLSRLYPLCNINSFKCQRSVTYRAVNGICTSSSMRQDFFDAQAAADHVSDNWGRRAGEYERAFSSKFEGYAASVLDHVQRDVSNVSDAMLLDVGCGTGAVLQAAINSQSSVFGHIHCSDFSQNMVTLAEQKYQRHAISQCTSNPFFEETLVSFSTSNAEDLPQEWTDKYDAAMSMFALIFCENRVQALQEVNRVLKPGGVLAVAGWAPVKEVEWVYFSNKALKAVLGSKLPAVPKDRVIVPSFQCYSDLSILTNELKESGFERIKTEKIKQRFMFTQKEDLCQLWSDMAMSFPTLEYMMNNLESGSLCDSTKDEIAESFATLIIQRGPPNSKTDEGIAYLDGTAHVGFGYKA